MLISPAVAHVLNQISNQPQVDRSQVIEQAINEQKKQMANQMVPQEPVQPEPFQPMAAGPMQGVGPDYSQSNAFYNQAFNTPMPQMPQYQAPQEPSQAQALSGILGMLAGPQQSAANIASIPFNYQAAEANQQYGRDMQAYKAQTEAVQQQIAQLMQRGDISRAMADRLYQAHRDEQNAAMAKQQLGAQIENQRRDDALRSLDAYSRVRDGITRQGMEIVKQFGEISPELAMKLIEMDEAAAKNFGQAPVGIVLPSGETLNRQKIQADLQSKQERIRQLGAANVAKIDELHSLMSLREAQKANISRAQDAAEQRNAIALLNATTERMRLQLSQQTANGKKIDAVQKAYSDLQAANGRVGSRLNQASKAKFGKEYKFLTDRQKQDLEQDLSDDERKQLAKERTDADGKRVLYETLRSISDSVAQDEAGNAPRVNEMQRVASGSEGVKPFAVDVPKGLNGPIGGNKAKALQNKYNKKIGGIQFN